MNDRYQIIFLGLEKPKEHFYRIMTRLGVTRSMIDKIIGSAPVILKQDLELEQAKNYASAIVDAGGKIKVQSYSPCSTFSHQVIPPLANFTMCPQCGHKQLKAKNCIRCGFALEK
mgnify:CR=1 FL=1